jgi:hypothetical protein
MVGARQLVFVFGMGRSGSSALTRLLALCGAELPERLVGANASNPAGHWEPLDVLDLNEAILWRRGATWWDPTLRLQSDNAFSEPERQALVRRIERVLDTLPPDPLLIIKEPRIAALSDVWFEASRRRGFALKIVIPVRHPDEAAASLLARDGATFELSSALWLKYNLLAERRSRGLPRVFVEYSNVLNDWRKEITRISEQLSIDFGQADEAAIDRFLDRALHRQRSAGPVRDAFGLSWVSETYEALVAACRDETLDTAKLDEIFAQFAACEHAFRTALDQFRARFRPPN